jgi:hypothetical protein
MKKWAVFSIFFLMVFSSLWSQPPAIEAKTSGMQKFPGFFTFYWDAGEGKIWLEVEKFDQEFLYVSSLPAGLGSYDVRLDRNQPERTRIVKFERVGPKVLLVQSNYSFRATSDDPDVVKAVEDAFAKSVLWGFEIAAEGQGRVLVDATRFFLRDASGAIGALNRANQGPYSVDVSRSAIYLPRTKSFPQNTEFEVILSFVSNAPGNFVRQVAPDAETFMLRQHHSFIHLPDHEFKPRLYDPRVDFQVTRFMDFAAPTEEPIVKRFILRHRLKKKNPRAAVSDPVKPIVYYVDRGTPEPMRSAVIEGASWWNEAFEALGYRDAFQVKLLPEDADPMDIRYNLVSWVHRATHGYCFGGSISDPRTGEILKAQIVLDSLHIRTDYLIAQALKGSFDEGKDNSREMMEMALASIRQISCHEVGHTLGPEHNFAGSANDRASAMDYPHPLVKIRKDGTLDLSDAYVKGIGEWDKVFIAYGYQDFPEGADEGKELRGILDRAFAKGLYFLASDDVPLTGGVTSSSQPLVARWDNGPDPVAELERVTKIRSIALATFSEKRIRPWAPLAVLEEVLVPAYLFHRYQVDAAASVLGGQNYFHKHRGDAQKDLEIVPAASQRRALDVLLQTIKPEFLALDQKILNLIPPRPPKYGQTPELFPGYTGRTFDPLAAAETAANLTIRMILQPTRASRLVDHHARNNEYPGLAEVIDRLLGATWKSSGQLASSSYHAEIQRAVDNVALIYLMRLAVDEENASPQARAIAMLKLDELKKWLESKLSEEKDEGIKAHYFYGMTQVSLFLKDPKAFKIPQLLIPPTLGPI